MELNYILYLVIAIGIVIVLFFIFDEIAYGQTVEPPVPTPPAKTATPPAVTPPTVTNVPTPTSPTPNLQYLPQKAFVQSYAPEIGVPSSAVPLQALPTVVAPPLQQPVQQNSTGMPDIMSIISILTGAAGIGYAKLVGNKTNKVETVVKEVVLPATVQTKQDQLDMAEFSYKANEQAANDLKGTKPNIKLETLTNGVKDLTEKASKA